MKRAEGFTLVELAIVLVIVGFLLTMGFQGLGTLYERKYHNESKARLEAVREALLNFVRVNQYLPCPDTDGDGVENRNPSGNERCSATSGNLPWNDLGLTQAQVKDGYGQLFSYVVNGEANDDSSICDDNKSASYFCKNGAPKFDLQNTPPTPINTDHANLTVVDHANGVTLATQASAVVVAHNKRPCPVAVPGHEQTNCIQHPDASGANNTFYGGSYEDGVFDDQFISIHGNQIKAAAGL